MLCDECQPKYDAWLTPRKLFTEARVDYIGRDTPKERERQLKDRADRWYRTVNSQLDLIHRICRDKHQITEPTQQALFEMETV